MEKNKAKKEVNASGRVTLPPELKEVLGWDEKSPVELWFNAADNEVVIRLHDVACVFCGAREGLSAYRNKYICPRCRKELAE
jgi:transcriptional pleiotropic regulator of transition state genes